MGVDPEPGGRHCLLLLLQRRFRCGIFRMVGLRAGRGMVPGEFPVLLPLQDLLGSGQEAGLRPHAAERIRRRLREIAPK